MTVLAIVVGAAVGAPLRYWIDRTIRTRRDTLFPWGTLLVNVMASLVLGVVVGASSVLPGWLVTTIGTGFCGALSTFSTFGYEVLRLVEERAWRPAALNVAVSVLLALGAATCGWAMGAAVAG